MVEQFHLLQATLLFKLDSMDSRLQACEAHLLHHSRPSSVPPPPSQDPKGKAPMVSPILSPTASPHLSPALSPHLSPAPTLHIPSPHPSPSTQKTPPHDPITILSSSSLASSSFPSDPQHFELAARTPTTPTQSPSSDSEATPLDPTRYVTLPPSPPPPPPPPPPPTSPFQPSPSPRVAPTPYRRRKMAVSKLGSSTSPPPP